MLFDGWRGNAGIKEKGAPRDRAERPFPHYPCGLQSRNSSGAIWYRLRRQDRNSCPVPGET